MNETRHFDSNVACCAGVYESLVAYFSSGDDKGNITARLREYREYVFGNGNALDVFYTDLLYAICVFAMLRVHGNCFRGIPEPLPRFGKTTWNDAML